MKSFFAVLLLFTLTSQADVVEPRLSEKSPRAIILDADYYAYLNYSPFDLLLPNKWGFTLGKIRNDQKSTELEYLRGSVSAPFFIDDLGEMTEERLTLMNRRHFGRGYFNFTYGLSYNRFVLHLGNEYLSSLSMQAPNSDFIHVETLGFHVGLGSQHVFQNRVSVGVDWISWAQPLVTTRFDNAFGDYVTNEDDRNAVDQVIKVVSYLPRFVVLKVRLGYMF
jgi:hypothetical protein